jgi:hypothetical protein
VKSDPVNHPAHYTEGGVETIEYIKSKLTPEQFRGYIKGNVLKYISRENGKGGNEDLKKAAWYLLYLVTGGSEACSVLYAGTGCVGATKRRRNRRRDKRRKPL